MKSLFKIIFCFVISIGGFAQTATTWLPTGPNLFPINASGQINGIGRTTQIKFDPSNATRMYATTASGGLWMSNDTGLTWGVIGTDVLPAMNCASVLVDHTTPTTLYLGSGDPNYYWGGYGVWKSTDGGSTWNLSSNGISTGLIIEMAMDPLNNNNIVAATDNGIFLTTNAGANWSQTLNAGDFKDMVVKPGSLDTIYAVTSSQVWRSIDFGNTWNQITSGVFVPTGNGAGMRLAVSASNSNIVYVGMIADEGTILKSVDGGTNFTTVYHNPAKSLVGYDSVTSGQGNYNFSMTCDPNNADVVYVAAHCVWKSLDGGITWTQLTDWYDKCHTDMHCIRVNPFFTNMLLDANDGGIFLSYNGGVSWQSRCDGLGATEIYNAAQSNLKRDLVSIGTQDNGELYFDNGTWRTNRGGDWAAQMAFSYLGANVVYYSDNGNRRPVNGSETSYNLPVTAANSVLLAFNRKIPNSGFASKTEVYLTQILNNSSPSWTQVGTISANIVALHSSFADSSVLFAVDDNSKIYRCDNVFASSPVWNSFTTPAATSVSTSVTSIANNINVVYLTCGDKVYRSTNKGQTFTNVSTGIPAGLNIIGMYHDEFSANEDVYVCTAQNVYFKNASMGTWQNISYNLPTIANIQEFMFHNPGNASSVLRVGYYGRGVWELPVNTSFPPAPDFVADQIIVCPNIAINFSDLTYGNPTAWNWSFPGGTPSSSAIQNPTISYSAPGNYPVTLTVGNANGTNSITKTTYITITSPQSLPITEGFAGVFPPNTWSLFDYGNDGVNWQINNSVGGYSTSSECTFFDNYDIDATGKYDEIRTETFDLSSVSQPVLTFDVAYAPYGAPYLDSLAVLVSTDCGQNFTQLYLKGGPALGTAPQNTNFFTPANSEWRTDTINLSAYTGQAEVMVAFKNIGHYGNALYIDNIDLLQDNTFSIQENFNSSVISVFPNPTDQFVNISARTKENKMWTISVKNYLGQTIYRSIIENPGKIFSQNIDLTSFAAGIYFLNLSSGNEVYTKKIVKEK